MRNNMSNRVGTFPLEVIRPPPGLHVLMEGLAREVLKHNPPDIYRFAADYFEKLIELRKEFSLKGRSVEIQEIVKENLQRLSANMLETTETPLFYYNKTYKKEHHLESGEILDLNYKKDNPNVVIGESIAQARNIISLGAMKYGIMNTNNNTSLKEINGNVLEILPGEVVKVTDGKETTGNVEDIAENQLDASPKDQFNIENANTDAIIFIDNNKIVTEPDEKCIDETEDLIGNQIIELRARSVDHEENDQVDETANNDENSLDIDDKTHESLIETRTVSEVEEKVIDDVTNEVEEIVTSKSVHSEESSHQEDSHENLLKSTEITSEELLESSNKDKVDNQDNLQRVSEEVEKDVQENVENEVTENVTQEISEENQEETGEISDNNKKSDVQEVEQTFENSNMEAVNEKSIADDEMIEGCGNQVEENVSVLDENKDIEKPIEMKIVEEIGEGKNIDVDNEQLDPESLIDGNSTKEIMEEKNIEDDLDTGENKPSEVIIEQLIEKKVVEEIKEEKKADDFIDEDVKELDIEPLIERKIICENEGSLIQNEDQLNDEEKNKVNTVTEVVKDNDDSIAEKNLSEAEVTENTNENEHGNSDTLNEDSGISNDNTNQHKDVETVEDESVQENSNLKTGVDEKFDRSEILEEALNDVEIGETVLQEEVASEDQVKDELEMGHGEEETILENRSQVIDLDEIVEVNETVNEDNKSDNNLNEEIKEDTEIVNNVLNESVTENLEENNKGEMIENCTQLNELVEVDEKVNFAESYIDSNEPIKSEDSNNDEINEGQSGAKIEGDANEDQAEVNNEGVSKEDQVGVNDEEKANEDQAEVNTEDVTKNDQVGVNDEGDANEDQAEVNNEGVSKDDQVGVNDEEKANEDQAEINTEDVTKNDQVGVNDEGDANEDQAEVNNEGVSKDDQVGVNDEEKANEDQAEINTEDVTKNDQVGVNDEGDANEDQAEVNNEGVTNEDQVEVNDEEKANEDQGGVNDERNINEDQDGVKDEGDAYDGPTEIFHRDLSCEIIDEENDVVIIENTNLDQSNVKDEELVSPKKQEIVESNTENDDENVKDPLEHSVDISPSPEIGINGGENVVEDRKISNDQEKIKNEDESVHNDDHVNLVVDQDEIQESLQQTELVKDTEMNDIESDVLENVEAKDDIVDGVEEKEVKETLISDETDFTGTDKLETNLNVAEIDSDSIIVSLEDTDLIRDDDGLHSKIDDEKDKPNTLNSDLSNDKGLEITDRALIEEYMDIAQMSSDDIDNENNDTDERSQNAQSETDFEDSIENDKFQENKDKLEKSSNMATNDDGSTVHVDDDKNGNEVDSTNLISTKDESHIPVENEEKNIDEIDDQIIDDDLNKEKLNTKTEIDETKVDEKNIELLESELDKEDLEDLNNQIIPYNEIPETPHLSHKIVLMEAPVKKVKREVNNEIDGESFDVEEDVEKKLAYHTHDPDELCESSIDGKSVDNNSESKDDINEDTVEITSEQNEENIVSNLNLDNLKSPSSETDVKNDKSVEEIDAERANDILLEEPTHSNIIQQLSESPEQMEPTNNIDDEELHLQLRSVEETPRDFSESNVTSSKEQSANLSTALKDKEEELFGETSGKQSEKMDLTNVEQIVEDFLAFEKFHTELASNVKLTSQENASSLTQDDTEIVQVDKVLNSEIFEETFISETGEGFNIDKDSIIIQDIVSLNNFENNKIILILHAEINDNISRAKRTKRSISLQENESKSNNLSGGSVDDLILNKLTNEYNKYHEGILASSNEIVSPKESNESNTNVENTPRTERNIEITEKQFVFLEGQNSSNRSDKEEPVSTEYNDEQVLLEVNEEELFSKDNGSGNKIEPNIFEKASIIIQKVFRGFRVRKYMKTSSNHDESRRDSAGDAIFEKIEEPILEIYNKSDAQAIDTDLKRRLNILMRSTSYHSPIDSKLYTVSEEKNLSSSDEESSTFSSAATKIQAGVRGFLTRKYFQRNKTGNSSDTTAPSIGEDSRSIEEYVTPANDFKSSTEDSLSKIVVATSTIFMEQLEHFDKKETVTQQKIPDINLSEVNKDSVEGMSRVSQNRKRLRREDAIQVHSPFSSGETPSNRQPSKISEDDEHIGELAQSIISEIETNNYTPIVHIKQSTNSPPPVNKQNNLDTSDEDGRSNSEKTATSEIDEPRDDFQSMDYDDYGEAKVLELPTNEILPKIPIQSDDSSNSDSANEPTATSLYYDRRIPKKLPRYVSADIETLVSKHSVTELKEENRETSEYLDREMDSKVTTDDFTIETDYSKISDSKLLHSSEFHDSIVLPTKIVRKDGVMKDS